MFFIELVKICKTKYLFYVPNDWLLIENKVICKIILNDFIQLLNDNEKKL